MNKKTEKKIQKLRADLQKLEEGLRTELGKKKSGKIEPNLAKIHGQISAKLEEIEQLTNG